MLCRRFTISSEAGAISYLRWDDMIQRSDDINLKVGRYLSKLRRYRPRPTIKPWTTSSYEDTFAMDCSRY
jgi:hypothetical protein